MKTFFMAAIGLLAVTSCTNESEETVINQNEQGYAPVTVHVSNFSITQEEMFSGSGTTRGAEDPSSYFGEGAITLAFYDAEGREVSKTTQVKADAGTYTTFGEFSANLPVGHYTMVAVAYAYYDGDAFILTSPTEAAFTSERPRETFSKVQGVTVTNASPLNIDVTLNRISSWLKIISTDGRPAGAKKIRTTFGKGGKDFNPTTGLAITDTGFSQTNNPSTATGATIEVNVVPFVACADDAEEKMTITIEALDADDNVLATKVVDDVPFKRNRQTTLTGKIFTADPSGAGLKLETSWLPGNTVEF